MCTVPKELAVHKTTTAKGSHRVDSLKSAFIFKTRTHLFQLDHVSCGLFYEDWSDNGNFLRLRITYKVAHKARSLLALY